MVFRGQHHVQVVDDVTPCFLTSQKADWLSITEFPSSIEIFRYEQPNRSVDLSRYSVSLSPGVTYQIKTNDSTAIIHLDPDAREVNDSRVIQLVDKATDEIACGSP